MMKIIPAKPEQAKQIAELIMLAMNYECCQHLAGPHHTLKDFAEMMTELVAKDNTQYSYQNTTVALNDQNDVIGICVSYDGAKLHDLRKAFIEAAQQTFGIDHHNMVDEAQSDELYIDSLAVNPDYRRQGIAKRLLQESLTKAKQMGISKVGLLVDKDNPYAEQLYKSLGFRYMNDAMWGGHPMKHLQYNAIFFA